MKNLALVVLLLVSAVAHGAKNQALSDYAKARPRDPVTKAFLERDAADLALRVPARASGLANPSHAGASTMSATIAPATARRAGSITVTLPEHYRGSSNRPLLATDIRGKTHALPTTRVVERGLPTSPFAPAKVTATIPAGVVLSPNGVEGALRSAPIFGREGYIKVTPSR